MRTTLDIDEDILAAAKEIAAARQKTAGQIISELARASLTQPRIEGTPSMRNGVPQLPHRNAVVTPDLIEKLLNDEA
jgi:hypothetical protein